MIARSYAWLGLAVLVLGCGAAGDSAARRSVPASSPGSSGESAPAVVFLGTSLTAGLGVDPDQAYPAVIQRRLDSLGLRYRVVNAGVSGESSAGAVRRIGWLLREPPAVLVIETGANDGLRGQDPDSLRRNLQALIDSTRVRAPRTIILLAAMEALPNLGFGYRRRFRALYPAVARQNGVRLLPFLLTGVAGVDSLNQQDGIHPTPAGHRRVADNVWPVLRTVLADR